MGRGCEESHGQSAPLGVPHICARWSQTERRLDENGRDEGRSVECKNDESKREVGKCQVRNEKDDDKCLRTK